MEDYSQLHGDDKTVQHRLEQISQQTSASVSNLEEDENASKDLHDGDGAVLSLRETTGGDKKSNKAAKRKKGFQKVIEDHLLEFVAHEPTHYFTNIGDAARQCQPIMTIVDLEGKSKREIEDLVSLTEAQPNATAIGTDVSRVDISGIHEETKGKNTDHVMVLGDVGAGKTVTCKKYAQAVSKGEVESLRQIEVVHAIRAFDLQTEATSNAFDHIFTEQVGSKLTKDLQQEGKEWMANNAHKTLVVVDGLDQVTEQLGKPHGKMTDETKARSIPVLSNILSGDIYPGLKILSTARWRVYWNLLKTLKPSKTIALRGFTDESMEEVIRKLCNKDEAEKIIHHLKMKAPQLLSLCKTPMFLIYTVRVLKENLSDPPDTISGIMASVLRIFSSSMHSDADINVLMKLAHHGIKDNRFTFTSAYVDKLGIRQDQLRSLISVNAVLIPFQDQVDKDDLRFQYSHQSLQELLATVHLFNLHQDHFNKYVRSALSNPEMEFVLKLLYGIVFNLRTTNAVEKYIKDRNCDIESCKETLMQQLQSLIADGKIKDEKVISLIHEGGLDFVAKLQPEVNEIDIGKYVYNPGWSYVTLSVISKFSTLGRVYLKNLKVTSTLISLLNESVDKIKTFQVVWLTFFGEIPLSQCNRLGKILKCSNDTTFKGCKLNSDKLQRISADIARAKTTQSLIFSLAILDDPLVDSSCMPHIVDIVAETGAKMINFRHCRMNKEKIDALNIKLEKAKYKISILQVIEEKFKATRDDVSSLCRILPQIDYQLWLEGWEITDADISMLWDALDSGYSPNLHIYVKPQGKYKTLVQKIGKITFEPNKVKKKPDVFATANDEEILVSSPDEQLTDSVEKLTEAESYDKLKEDQSSFIDSPSNKTQEARTVHASTVTVEGNEKVTKTTKQEKIIARESCARSSKPNTAIKDLDVSLITKEGQVIVSKTIRKELGSDGGAIIVGGCVVTFPKYSLQRKTEIVAKAEINRAKWPRGYFLITPMLYVDGGENLAEPASVRMISWCINTQSKENENATVDLLHCDDESHEWNPISKLPFTNETVYQFECLNFSPYAIGIPEDAIDNQTFLVKPFLFSNPQNMLAYTFSVTDEMVLEAVKKDMRESGFTFSLSFTTPSVKKGDEIAVRLQCARPDGFSCDPPQALFKIDSEMAKMHRYIEYFVVNSDKQNTTKIQLKSSILKNGVAIANNQPFIYNWKFESEAQSSQESMSSVTSEDQTQRLSQQPSASSQNTGSPIKLTASFDVHLGDKIVKENAIENFVTEKSNLSSRSQNKKMIVGNNSNIEESQISGPDREDGSKECVSSSSAATTHSRKRSRSTTSEQIRKSKKKKKKKKKRKHMDE